MRAELKLCNRDPEDALAAVGFKVGDTWQASGWYEIESGKCATLVGGNLRNRYYYIRAKAGDHVWEGDAHFCTTSAAFTNLVDGNCAARNLDSKAFYSIDTGKSFRFTSVLTCDGCNSYAPGHVNISLPRINHSLTVVGQTFRVSADGTLAVDFSGSALHANALVNTDLSEFQNRFGDIVRSQVNHNDDCDYILNVHTISLTPNGGGVDVYAAGHYEHWVCPEIESPFGDIELGKDRLFEQNGDITAHLEPQTNGDSVWMGVSITGMEADGLFGVILDSSWFGPYARDLILQSIPEVLQIGRIRDLLPSALRTAPLQLTGVRFFNQGGGSLGLQVTADVTVDQAQARQIWEALQ